MNTLKAKLFLLYISVCFSSFCAQAALKGSIINAPENGKLYLYQYFGSNYYKYDSTTVKKGQFKFALKVKPPSEFYQLGTDSQNSFTVILSNEEGITINADWKNMKAATINNSSENGLFRQMIGYNAQLATFESKAHELAPLKEKDPDRFNASMLQLQKQYDSINNLSSSFKNGVMSASPNTYFAKVLKMFNISPSIAKDSFFTVAELSDPEYTRGDMLMNKISFYFQKYAVQDEAGWATETEYILSKFPKKTPNRELAYMNIIQIMSQNQMQPSGKLIKGLKEEYGTDPKVKAFLSVLPKGELQEGDEAPDVMLNDMNGKKVSLSSLKGKIVLIDFWASWCGPCRMENPNVVAVYNKYKNKDFTIYSVSLDNAKENWINAIKKDGLLWPSHVSDLKGWQSIGAAAYGVKSIPATFLVDKNGIIIAKNLRGPSLDKKLSELIP